MLLYILALITLCAAALLIYYVWRVPEGPACPRCGMVTRRADGPAHRLDAFLRIEDLVVDAFCPACGWDGRLRRGPRPERVRSDHPRSGGRP